ncbi:MAG: CHC2 zinc finger domain-containing protein [Anaerovoracaceae bacterium]
MTRDELKEMHSMKDIVLRYGIRINRAWFAPCPFHQEKTASMKIYNDSYHCFGCGESGDIFSFVMKMEEVSFREAFLILGGTYEQDSFESKIERYHLQKCQIMRKKEEEKNLKNKKVNNNLIGIYRDWIEKTNPFSDVWTDCYNALQYQLYVHEILNKSR